MLLEPPVADVRLEIGGAGAELSHHRSMGPCRGHGAVIHAVLCTSAIGCAASRQRQLVDSGAITATSFKLLRAAQHLKTHIKAAAPSESSLSATRPHHHDRLRPPRTGGPLGRQRW